MNPLLMMSAITAIGLGVLAFVAWKRRRAQSPAFRSIAILRRSPPVLTEARLRALVERALGDVPEIVMLPVPPRDDVASLFAFMRGELAFGVICVPRPYVDASMHDEVRASVEDESVVRALTEHKAWISVDHMRGSAEAAEIDAIIGRVAAELIDEEAMLLYDVRHQRFAKIDEMTRDMLRGPAPMMVFGADGTEVAIEADDAAIEAAKRQAQDRWQEFLIAWHNRSPEEHFSVKGPFHDGRNTEHMWLTVEDANEQGVRGAVGNVPSVVKNLKEGDPASIAFADIEDWLIFEPSGRMRGGFSMGAMLARKMG